MRGERGACREDASPGRFVEDHPFGDRTAAYCPVRRLGGIGSDRRPIQHDVAHAHQSRLLAQPDHLHEQPSQRRQMPLPNIADRANIEILRALTARPSTRSSHAFAIRWAGYACGFRH